MFPTTIRSILRRSFQIGATLATIAASFVASDARAQDKPVAFNAGFGNQGSAWIPTADYLRQRLLIETLTPSHNWDRPFNEQSGVYSGALNSWGRSAVIGLSHSNGGIVTRNYVHLNGAASRLDRLATIGTPHQGAPIAANVVNGNVANYFGNTAGSIFGALYFYSQNDPNWNVNPVVDFVTGSAFQYLNNLAAFLANTSALSGLGIRAGFPVTADVSPGSGFLGQYNSAAHLATESSVLRTRVGISTQSHPNGALFRLLSSDPAGWRRVQAITAHGALALYFYYANHPDWWLAGNAYQWLQVYWYTTLIDVVWQDFIGTLQYWNGFYAVVTPSDGFIPHWSSQYPGATLQYNMNLPTFNFGHTEQKNHPAARNQFEAIMTRDFQVSPRPYTPPPPPNTPPCTPTGTQIICPL